MRSNRTLFKVENVSLGFNGNADAVAAAAAMVRLVGGEVATVFEARPIL